MAGRVAVVDDEPNIRETVQFALEREGYTVDSYADGADAWIVFQENLPDVIVLDIILPRMDGLELCRKIRAISEKTPIIFLTSRDDEIDRVLGLELGADDYLCKPFSMRELIARIKVLFRRLTLAKMSDTARRRAPVRTGKLELDIDQYRATWDRARVDLTVTEFMMLRALAKRPGHVKTRDDLNREAYRYDNYVSDRTIDSHIKRLRRKLEQVDPSFDQIETVYGVGYRWKVEE